MTAPDPMTPPDCDLRGYDYMPWFGARLFGSTFYTMALANPRAGWAGQKLWWEAWTQCPAGSLPADDATLCRMADFGADLKAWSKCKTVALHGFVLCADGRLYHPLICERAVLAFGKRVKERKRKAAYRKGRDADEDGDGHGGPEDVPPPVPRDNPGTSHTPSVSCPPVEERRGEESKKEERKEEPPYAPPAETVASPQAAPPKDRRKPRKHLDPGWEPNAADRAYASQLGLESESLALDFKDYWIGHGKPMADWQRTWQKWCRTSAKHASLRQKPKQTNGFFDVSTDDILERIRVQRERDEANVQTH